jgi:SAM-dependent methyltransferase
MSQPPTTGRGDRKPGPGVLADLIAGKWTSQAISVAAELGVADILKEGPRSALEIAEAVGASEDGVYRLLRALASVGLFATVAPRRFALTPLGEYLRHDVPGSLRGWARFMGHDLTWRPWGRLAYSVRTGKAAFDHVFDSALFPYLSEHWEAAAVFNEAMTAVSTMDAVAVLKAYDFSEIRTLVDVGGGHGLLLATILKTSTEMRGILFDLPHAAAGASELLQREGVAERCAVVPGDFFQSIPGGGDAYLMKLILDNFDDDRSSQLLGNCSRVMRPGAKLLVIDRVIPAGDDADIGKFTDLEMLVLTPGGRERTEAEFRQLYEEAGLELARVIPTRSLKCIVEGIRR